MSKGIIVSGHGEGSEFERHIFDESGSEVTPESMVPVMAMDGVRNVGVFRLEPKRYWEIAVLRLKGERGNTIEVLFRVAVLNAGSETFVGIEKAPGWLREKLKELVPELA